MPEQPAKRYRFGVFELDAATGELRRQGIRIKLNAQPFQALLLLVEHQGELLTREDISRELWPDGTFVDYEHGVNSAMNRIREALGDKASSPRYIETLARRGYRFIAPVEKIGVEIEAQAQPVMEAAPAPMQNTKREGKTLGSILATPQQLPKAPHNVVRILFLLLQCMYLAFYIGALSNLTEIDGMLSVLSHSTEIFVVLIVTAAVLIPARAFLIAAFILRAPAAGRKFLTMWPFLLPFDLLWSLSPFLLLHHINFGVALACTALLVYSPFAQRSLVLMGAGTATARASTNMPDLVNR